MRKMVILLGLVILAAALSSGCGYGGIGTGPDPTPGGTANSVPGNPAVVKGQAAPEIVLQDLEGRTVRLSDYRGRVVILNFWASWCPPCKAEMPELEQASRDFALGSDAVLLTVNLTDGSRETPAKARQYILDNHYSMPVWLDTSGKAADAYKITSIPTTFIIDKQGNIHTRFSRATTKEALQGYVDQLK